MNEADRRERAGAFVRIRGSTGVGDARGRAAARPKTETADRGGAARTAMRDHPSDLYGFLRVADGAP